MKKVFSYRFAQPIAFYTLLLGAVTLYLLTFPLSTPDGFWISFLYSMLYPIGLPSWRYVVYIFKNDCNFVWAFTALGLFLGVGGLFMVMVSSQPLFLWNKEGNLRVIFSYLFPLLPSSCIAGWIVAPSRIGKMIFVGVIALLVLMCIYLCALSKNMLYLPVLVLLVMIVVVLRLWPNDNESEGNN